MTTYVLVHGAWHGSWCWVRVAERLRAAGHTVFTPTLTGLAERSHLLNHHITLTTHIKDVAGVLVWEDLRDVVLVGHSYGGPVISGVAERVADRIKTLVYLDALILDDGQCSLDARSPEQNAIFREKAKAGGGWRIAPTKAADFNVNETDRAWVDGNCTDMTIGCFTERLHLSALETRSRTASSSGRAASRAIISTRPSPRPKPTTVLCHTLSGGHDLMVDQPDEVTALLLDL